MYDGTLLVVGLSIELFENEKHAYNQLLLNFPAEIELCGVVKFQDHLSTGTLVKEILQVCGCILSMLLNLTTAKTNLWY